MKKENTLLRRERQGRGYRYRHRHQPPEEDLAKDQPETPERSQKPHKFYVDVALKVGLLQAVIINNLRYWIFLQWQQAAAKVEEARNASEYLS